MKICAVLVTFNRLELLKKALDSFVNQTRLPDQLIIVDNASSDGTAEYLSRWYDQNKNNTDIIIITNEINLGGAGGFYTGLKRATELDNDWVWVSDDDAILEEKTLEILEKNIEERQKDETISAVCTKVTSYGQIDVTHRNRIHDIFVKKRFLPVDIEEYKKTSFYCDSFSYVGSMMNRLALDKAGLTEKDFFIWNDDKEHAYRLSKYGKIICFTQANVNHNVEQKPNELTWKSFYLYRNELILQKKHFSKRYYVFLKLWFNTKAVLSKIPEEKAMIHCAIKEADDNKLGINNIYRPGWKVK